jgi:FkbM family methyltransferase
MLGFHHALFIEANPAPLPLLKETWKDAWYASVVNCAILDKNGPVEFTITNFDQASSLLKPTRALARFTIQEDRVITVPGKTLDELLKERNLMPEWFNFLVMDTQGAELLALKGAVGLLPHVDAVCTEVNFEELYQGGAQIDEIDDFLASYGFRRVYASSRDRAWADAVYLKEQFASKARVEIPPCLSLLFGGDTATAKPAIQLQP